jgi:hypothetical protein
MWLVESRISASYPNQKKNQGPGRDKVGKSAFAIQYYQRYI